jgi:hypothetical protein
MSDYIFVDGAGWLFGASVLTALFPTDPIGAASLSAQIHRYAAGVVFCCVPIAAALLGFRLADAGQAPRYRNWLWCSALATGAVVLIFLVSHLGGAPAPLAESVGVLQRVMFGCVIVLLAQLLYLPTAQLSRRPAMNR